MEIHSHGPGLVNPPLQPINIESISESISQSLSLSESISEIVSESTPSVDSQLLRKSAVLPNTGEESSSWTGLLGAGLLLGGLYKRRKKEDEKE
ncbi:LPXTG cell wall anchor domain-containing protein [Streptococcus sp. 32226D021BW]